MSWGEEIDAIETKQKEPRPRTRTQAVVILVEPRPRGRGTMGTKMVRHVRTPEGRALYDQEIGAVIRPDIPDRPHLPGPPIRPRPQAVIFDRDGTLAAVPKAPLSGTSEAWAEFNAAMVFDPPAPQVVALLRSVRPGVVRIMVSGRAEGDWPGDRRRRFAMQDWIAKHGLPIDELYMRSGGDMRRDSVVKEELLVDEILLRYDVVLAVDDRPEVLAVWKRHGIATLQVVGPDMEFPIAQQGR